MAEYKDIVPLKKQIADIKKAMHSPNSDYLTGYLCALSATEGVIAYLPAADVVEVVHARWIWNEENECFVCSNCELSALNDYRGDSTNSNYCPSCGAKMDGERKE